MVVGWSMNNLKELKSSLWVSDNYPLSFQTLWKIIVLFQINSSKICNAVNNGNAKKIMSFLTRIFLLMWRILISRLVHMSLCSTTLDRNFLPPSLPLSSFLPSFLPFFFVWIIPGWPPDPALAWLHQRCGCRALLQNSGLPVSLLYWNKKSNQQKQSKLLLCWNCWCVCPSLLWAFYSWLLSSWGEASGMYEALHMCLPLWMEGVRVLQRRKFPTGSRGGGQAGQTLGAVLAWGLAALSWCSWNWMNDRRLKSQWIEKGARVKY